MAKLEDLNLEGDLSGLELVDLATIINMYEKGCNAILTQEAALAVLSRFLNTSMCLAAQGSDNLQEPSPRNHKKGSNNTPNQDTPVDTEQDVGGLPDSNKTDKEDDSAKKKLKRMMRDCFPCLFRIVFQGGLDPKKDLSFISSSMLETLKGVYLRLLNFIKTILDFFQGKDAYIDLCDFIKFFKNYICLPDLYMILAALMAFLINLSTELNFTMSGILIGLVSMLVVPLLTTAIDQLINFFLMAIKPIECVIDQVISLISKADWSPLFTKISQVQNISLGPKTGPKDIPGTQHNYVAPYNLFNVSYVGPSTSSSEARLSDPLVEDWLSMPRTKAIAASRQNQLDVDNAAHELDLLNKAADGVDATNPEASKRHQEQASVAKKKYEDAVSKRDLSQAQKLTQTITKVRQQVKSLLGILITTIKEAVAKIEAFVFSAVDEFKKLIGQYLGGTGTMINLVFKKLEITQLIGFIRMLITLYNNGWKDCDKDGIEATHKRMYASSNIGISSSSLSDDSTTDNKNNELITVTNPIDSDFDKEIAALLATLPYQSDFVLQDNGDGLGANQPAFKNEESQKDTNPQTGNNRSKPTGRDVRQQLRNSIQLTGNPILDSQISGTVDALLEPATVVFRCSSQTTTQKAEQVNSWIASLNTEGG